jgi:hypothetical protein
MCENCESGHACPRGQPRTACDRGSYAEVGKAECSRCDLGTFNDKTK